MDKSGTLLDDATIQEIVSDALNGIHIVSVKPEPAVPAGEHYMSTLLRVHIKFRRPDEDAEAETNIIIKSHPQGVLSQFVNESFMFVKELLVYNKIVPHIDEIHGQSITPKRLGSTRDNVLVLEDLKLKGFQMKNRVHKLDFEHAKEALLSLADFHANSVKLHDRSPELFEEIKVEKIYQEDNSYMRSFVINNFRTVGEEFGKIPHLRKYSDRIKAAGERTWDAVKEAVIPKQDVINVFNHGDFWTTNILYCYDDKQNIKEVKFVDFQFCRWGSPAFDLNMFFTTSLRDRKSIPKLTSIYLERLNKHLHPNKLSEEILLNELRRLDCYGFLTSLCTLPICILDPQRPLNFNETTADDFNKDFPEDRPNPYLTGLKDEGFINIIPEYLEFYEKMGLF